MFVVLAKINKTTRVLIQSFLPLAIPLFLNNLKRKWFISPTVPYTSFSTKATRTKTQAGQEHEARDDAEATEECVHCLAPKACPVCFLIEPRGRHTHNGEAFPH